MYVSLHSWKLANLKECFVWKMAGLTVRNETT